MRLTDAGYKEENAKRLLMQIRTNGIIGYSGISSEVNKYIVDTIDKLTKGIITDEQVKNEFKQHMDRHNKREAERKAKEEAERQERQRQFEEERQRRLLNALQIIGTLEFGLDETQFDAWLHHANSMITSGKVSYNNVFSFADFLQHREAEQQREIERAKRREQAEKERKEEQAKIDKEEEKRKALAAKNQFEFDGLLIERQEGKTNFLLPNENNEIITAYAIIERIANNNSNQDKIFKSFSKQITFENDNIKYLPYSERARLIFHFRYLHERTPIIEKADTVAAFINTALKYTDNIDLSRDWLACLDVFNTGEEQQQEKAASLFVYYGWSASFRTKYPRDYNVFYTVSVGIRARHYNIVDDDINKRFAAIEKQGRTFFVNEIISDAKLQYKTKYSQLQALLYPFLWWCDGVRMGLNKDAIEICNGRINKYIEELLSVNIDTPLDEHIKSVEIDKSDTGIIFEQPRQFDFTLDDMTFTEYTNKIDAEYNKANAAKLGAARSQKAAERHFSKVIGNIGDILTTQQLYAMGIDKDIIPRIIDKKIKRIKRGYYEIISG